jgi:hypothetical protein
MGKTQDPGSGINIPDPQHCFEAKRLFSLKKAFITAYGSGSRRVRLMATKGENDDLLVLFEAKRLFLSRLGMRLSREAVNFERFGSVINLPVSSSFLGWKSRAADPYRYSFHKDPNSVFLNRFRFGI